MGQERTNHCEQWQHGYIANVKLLIQRFLRHWWATEDRLVPDTSAEFDRWITGMDSSWNIKRYSHISIHTYIYKHVHIKLWMLVHTSYMMISRQSYSTANLIWLLVCPSPVLVHAPVLFMPNSVVFVIVRFPVVPDVLSLHLLLWADFTYLLKHVHVLHRWFLTLSSTKLPNLYLVKWLVSKGYSLTQHNTPSTSSCRCVQVWVRANSSGVRRGSGLSLPISG